MQDSTSANASQPQTASEGLGKDLSDAKVNAIIQILSQLLSQLDALRSSSEKANTSFIAYMDRIVLLAGGTLTLIFTVLGSLSSHLHEAGRQAQNASYVLVTCWLLVSTVISALVFNVASINYQSKSDLTFGLQITSAKMRLSVLTVSGNTDALNLPDVIDPKTAVKNLRVLGIFRALAGTIVQVCVVAAFIFLALFIQSNITLLLNIPK